MLGATGWYDRTRKYQSHHNCFRVDELVDNFTSFIENEKTYVLDLLNHSKLEDIPIRILDGTIPMLDRTLEIKQIYNICYL